MRNELITDDAALAALATAWEALWRSVPDATPFQSPDWLLPWWSAFGSGRRPRIALLRDAEGGAPLGLLPLCRLEEGRERKLLPIGVGITDYNDALLTPDAPAEAASIPLRAALTMAAQEDGETSCDLPDLPPGAALRDAAAPAGWREERWTGGPCPVLPLPEGGGEVAAALRGPVPGRTLRKLRMACHRTERAHGGWTATLADAAAEAMPLRDWLVALHQARWTRQGEPGGVLADPRVLEFHRAALPRLAASGALRLYALRFGGRETAAAALCHTLRAGRDRLLFYLSAFDEAHAYESPGTILLGHIVEASVAEDLRELHFLRGGEAYKRAWGAGDRMNFGRRLRPPVGRA